MSKLTDREIRNLCVMAGVGPVKNPLIEPFSEPVSGDGVVSYGLTSAGYDLRLGGEVLVFKNTSGEAVDPKKFKDPDYFDRMFDRVRKLAHEPVTIPAHGYILGRSYEYLRIPRHMKGCCTGKSTLARCGIIVNVTPLEPDWEGFLTIEISNSCPCPAMVYVMEGIAQLEVETLGGEPETTYRDKKGIYMNQSDVTPARVRS
jgi:dCTP deaminase